MQVDKRYCMSSFLMFRTVASSSKTFCEGFTPKLFSSRRDRISVNNSIDLEKALKNQVAQATGSGKAAIALSGGIDSAILAKFMPKGSVAYTFKCVVPGVEVTDESPVAAKYAEECGLEHKILEVYWEDFESYLINLFHCKGAPIHSIEVQIAKAAQLAKGSGFSKLIFGESADVLYGGFDGLLSKDFTLDGVISRFSYVDPKQVLKDPVEVTEPYERYMDNGIFDMVGFLQNFFYEEAMGTYTNACNSTGVEMIAPFSNTKPPSLDLKRIRGGEPKYLVREIFKRLYPDMEVPEKIPMPRPMDLWLSDWKGPVRPEFRANCIENMTGDQKWLVFCLEKFLNFVDEKAS